MCSHENSYIHTHIFMYTPRFKESRKFLLGNILVTGIQNSRQLLLDLSVVLIVFI